MRHKRVIPLTMTLCLLILVGVLALPGAVAGTALVARARGGPTPVATHADREEEPPPGADVAAAQSS